MGRSICQLNRPILFTKKPIFIAQRERDDMRSQFRSTKAGRSIMLLARIFCPTTSLAVAVILMPNSVFLTCRVTLPESQEKAFRQLQTSKRPNFQTPDERGLRGRLHLCLSPAAVVQREPPHGLGDLHGGRGHRWVDAGHLGGGAQGN